MLCDHLRCQTLLPFLKFLADLLPLVFMTLIVGYTDHDHAYLNSETMFAIAITSIIPLSYYIGMGIAR